METFHGMVSSHLLTEIYAAKTMLKEMKSMHNRMRKINVPSYFHTGTAIKEFDLAIRSLERLHDIDQQNLNQ